MIIIVVIEEIRYHEYIDNTDNRTFHLNNLYVDKKSTEDEIQQLLNTPTTFVLAKNILRLKNSEINAVL